MAVQKLSIKIYPEKRKDKNGNLITSNVPIFLFIGLSGKRMPFYSGYKCDIELVKDGTMRQWDADLQRMKKNQVNKAGETSAYINNKLALIEGKVRETLENNPQADLNGIKVELNKLQGKEIKTAKTEAEKTIFDYFDLYRDNASFSENRKRQMKVTRNKLELLFPKITFETFDDKTLEAFRTELRKSLSQTSVNGELRRVRAFFKYSIDKGWMKNYPFEKFAMEEDIYGSPIFLSIQERNQLYAFEPECDRLRLVRDMFVLHCFIGARVGDFVRLKKEHLKTGAVEYYENKKLENNPKLIRVPLSQTAKIIIQKYEPKAGERLFPFISEQKYNLYLKELFELAKLTRDVTTLDKHTKKEITIPLNKLACSHMARKTFIGNLYKKTKDSVICSMSGHVEGSKAFARYFTVDDVQKRKALNLIK
jgi:site-specific recombinase XerD